MMMEGRIGCVCRRWELSICEENAGSGWRRVLETLKESTDLSRHRDVDVLFVVVLVESQAVVVAACHVE